LTLSAVIYTAF